MLKGVVKNKEKTKKRGIKVNPKEVSWKYKNKEQTILTIKKVFLGSLVMVYGNINTCEMINIHLAMSA